MSRILRLAAEAILILATLAYAAVVVRDFSRYVDHYPYLSVDDGLANVSYSLANEGRYGFMASPIQSFSATPRHEAFYNYGPWYFYFGAALIALFGYSLDLLRGIHPLGILAIASAGFWVFARHRSVVAGALLAFGLLQAFELSQRPMVRPDVFVSLFAVAFIVAAGIAIERRSTAAWGVAAAAAGCAAFSHLIAWALVPCCLGVLAVAIAHERPDAARVRRLVAACLCGFAAAALMFYGSFGFRVRDHLAFLFGYRQFLNTGPDATAPAATILGNYLHLAFDDLPASARWLLGAAVALCVLALGLVRRRSIEAKRAAIGLLLPPVAVLACYFFSLSTYGNYHSGYVILLQVAAWWCAASLTAFLLARLSVFSATAGAAARLAATTVLIAVLAARLTAFAPAGERFARIDEWAGIRDYTTHVLQRIPNRATVWGGLMFGIESPERVQLIQLPEGLDLAEVGRRTHAALQKDTAPQFVVWTFSERRAAVLNALGPKHTRQPSDLARLNGLFPDISYPLAGIVVGAPYGATRIYAGRSGAPAVHALPAVEAFDPASGVWDTHLDGPLSVTAVPSEPITFEVVPDAGPSTAERSVAMDLPTGRFLLRVRVTRSTNATRRMLAVTPTRTYRERAADLGPRVDFVVYPPVDDEVYLFHEHGGGPLYVSQFDDGDRASIEGVDAFRVEPSTEREQIEHVTFWDMPPLARWLPFIPSASGGRAAIVDQQLVVEGDASQSGYQLSAPPVAAPRGARVTVRTAFSGRQGVVCVGALNGANDVWLRRDGRPSGDLRFVVDGSGAFRLTFYNCSPSDAANLPSRFTIARARYAVDTAQAVDRWMALRAGAPLAEPAPPDFRVRTVPPGRTLSERELASAPSQVTEDDLVARSPIATRSGHEWRITGKAAGPFLSAMDLKPKLLIPGQRLFARGRVERGGVTFGLQQKGVWVRQIDVTTPGEFIVAIDAPRLGRYTAVVAHYITDTSLQSDVTISQLGWIGR